MKIKVADFIINHLASIGINKVFVVYGAANGDLIDAFTRTDKTEYVAVLHEQGGGFAAEGWAKITGKPGACIVTSGPGGHNLVTSIGNCFYDSVPCIFITGQINSRFLRPDPSIRQIGFQESDIVSVVKPMTKYAKMVTKATDIKYELQKALHLATEGRPGPVLLDLPLDISKQIVEEDDLVGYKDNRMKYDMLAARTAIRGFIDDLKHSKRPAIVVGGGIRIADALNELYFVMDQLKIPTFPTWNALDIVCDDNPYFGGRIGTYGGKGRNFGIQNSDLMLFVGSRLSGRITGGNVKSFGRGAKKYCVDVDEALLQPHLQQLPFDVNVHCDAKEFLFNLLTSLSEEKLPDFSEWMGMCKNWKDKYDPVLPKYYQEKLHPYVFARMLSQKMTKDDILVGDCGGNIVVLNHAFETKTGQRYFTNNGNSPMGFSLAGAMGAALAPHKGQVVCVIGDGGMNMNIQELQTIVNYNLPVKIIILNNHIYGITKAFQETNFQGRCEACGPKGYNPPDFIEIAKAYKIAAMGIYDMQSAGQHIDSLLAYQGPMLCDVNIHEHHVYDPRIFGWNTPIEDMYPYLPRDEFRANMLIEPVEGWENPAMPG